jgi:hypothetical protein
LLLSAAVVPVSAAGYSDTASVRKSDGFSTAWEKTKTYMVGSDIIGYMIYGYNTDWINEDYVWTMGKECASRFWGNWDEGCKICVDCCRDYVLLCVGQ